MPPPQNLTPGILRMAEDRARLMSSISLRFHNGGKAQFYFPTDADSSTLVTTRWAEADVLFLSLTGSCPATKFIDPAKFATTGKKPPPRREARDFRMRNLWIIRVLSNFEGRCPTARIKPPNSEAPPLDGDSALGLRFKTRVGGFPEPRRFVAGADCGGWQSAIPEELTPRTGGECTPRQSEF